MFNSNTVSLAALRLVAFSVILWLSDWAVAGGGVMLRDDACIIKIGFYEAHFTAYQPNTSGDTEFCEDLPDTGDTTFVLDYLHGSLKEVPVDFRIIRDATELGQFVRWEDVQALQDLDGVTVFYRPAGIESRGSYRVEYEFLEKGDYVGIVSAGHPTSDKQYTAVFPFSVGRIAYPFWVLYLLVAGLFVYLIRYAYESMSAGKTTD